MESVYLENEYYKDLEIRDETFRDMRMIDCTFENCKFHNVSLEHSEFIDCEFIDCNIVTLKSKECDVRSARVIRSNLIGVNWSELVNTGRKYASPIYKMDASFLKYNTFSQLNLAKVDFRNNTFDESMFDECNLKEAKFNKCHFLNTTITNSDIQHADFKDADGYYIDIKSNMLKDARFSFPEVTNLLDSLDITIE